MKVYVINHGGYTIGVYSRKKKMLEAYVKKCQEYKKEIIQCLEDAIQGIFRDEYDDMRKISKETILQILNLFQGRLYDSSKFSFDELTECTGWDYTFISCEIDH